MRYPESITDFQLIHGQLWGEIQGVWALIGSVASIVASAGIIVDSTDPANPVVAANFLRDSAVLAFGEIPDGATADLTFNLTGSATGDPVIPAWPPLDSGIYGMMFVSAPNTITVRLANLSGGAVTPASATYGAQIPQ
jgi:hypothetical protein